MPSGVARLPVGSVASEVTQTPDGVSAVDVHGALVGASRVLPNEIARMTGK